MQVRKFKKGEKEMKKLMSLALLLICLFAFIGCSEDVNVEIVTSVPSNVELNVGGTYQIDAKLSNSSGGALNYESKDSKVATVTTSGLVTAVKAGTVKIVIKATKADLTKEFTVTVKEAGKETKTQATTLKVGDTTKFEIAQLFGSQTPSVNVTGDAVEVDGFNVKALKAGTAVVVYDSEKLALTITVTVIEESVVETNSITILGAKNYLVLESVFELTISSTPETFSKEVEWKVSDETIATCVNGIVTPVKEGKVKVTATSKVDADVSATVEFEVIPATLVIDDFEIKSSEEVYYDLDTYTFTVENKANPEATATPKSSYVWTSSDEEVVSVVSRGKLMMLKEGTATITVLEEISGIEKTFDITVVKSPALESISIEGRKITTEENCTLTIKALPEHANYSVTWEALTPEIATIDEKGYVTPLVSGIAKFRATDIETKKTCEYDLEIEKAFDPNAKPESITIDSGGLKEVYIGYTIRLSVEVLPVGVSSAVEWVLHDTSKAYAKISEDGVVTGIAEGSVRVRAVSKVDPSVKSAYFVMNVIKKPELEPVPDMKGYEIVLMNADSALTSLDPFLDGYNSADKAFKQEAWNEVQNEYNCKIVVKAYPATAPWGNQRVNYLIDGATNGTTEPDFAVVSGAWINRLSAGNAAIDTTDFFRKYGMNQIEPALKEASSAGSKYHCVSIGLNTSRTYVIKGLFYNYGKIKSLGLESPAKLFNEGKWTFEGFIDYVLKAQALLGEKEYVMSGGPSMVWAGMVNAAGIKLADKTTMGINITHKYSLEAIATLQKVVENGAWSIDEIGYDGSNNPFNEQRALFSPGEYWFLKASNRYPEKLWGDTTEYGYVPFPYPSTVKKEDTRINFVGESVLMMVAGKRYTEGVKEEYVYRAVQDMYLRTIDKQSSDELYNPDSIKEASLKARVDDPESIPATIFYTASRTLFDPMFDESFQTEYSGTLTTAVIAAVKGKDAKEQLDAAYNTVLDSFIRTYG